MIPMHGEKPASYKQYKNQKFTKHTDLLKNSLRQIKDCSLKTEDKAALVVLLSEILVTELSKFHSDKRQPH